MSAGGELQGLAGDPGASVVASPLSAGEFSRLMQAVGPFEEAPLLAVAVSGGADSLALTLLLDEWVRQAGGELVALTVDHGLRAESAAEARQVGRWLAARGIAHRILSASPAPAEEPAPPLSGSGSGGGVQSRARALRFRLLEGWCRDHGCLHLVLAHHQEDQAETFLLRLARGSGVQGLSAMMSVAFRPACRLLRPLLSVTRERLRATLRAAGQDWVEDPGNHNPAFARVQVRQATTARAVLGLQDARLAATAVRCGRSLEVLLADSDRLAARCVELYPAGWAVLEPEAFLRAAPETALRVLASVLSVVGGRPWGPRLDHLQRLYEGLHGNFTPCTLHGCCLSFKSWPVSGLAGAVPADSGGREKRSVLLLVRELRGMPEPQVIRGGENRGGEEIYWDDRFALSLSPRAAGLTLRALGESGWGQLPVEFRQRLRKIMPLSAVFPLPSLYDGQAVLSLRIPGMASGALWMSARCPAPLIEGVSLRPVRAMGSARFRTAGWQSQVD